MKKTMEKTRENEQRWR